MSKYHPTDPYLVSGVGTLNKKQFFYTGRSGPEFVSESRHEAFTYTSREAAERMASNLSRMTMVHCVTFDVEETATA